jgi:hypothetical protein
VRSAVGPHRAILVSSWIPNCRELEFALAHDIGRASLSRFPDDAVSGKSATRSGFHPTGRLRYQAGPLRRQIRVAGPRPDRFGLLSYVRLSFARSAAPTFDDGWSMGNAIGQRHGISSPGMLSPSENVGLGDASVGVARNPLRDGAPPTGLFYQANCENFSFSRRAEVHEVSRSQFIDRRVSEDRPSCGV